MKLQLPISLIIIAGIVLTSCEKNLSSAYNTDDVLGKWILIYDSTFTGVGAINYPYNYSGQQGNYFDFATDSIIYTKEGSVLDTLTY